MGTTKTHIHTEEQNRLASIAKVLGHPARIAILQHLVKTKACVCGDLVDEIGLAQPTISQHLKEMKKIGIIQGTVEGTSVCYCINPSAFSEIKNLFFNFFKDIDINTCC